MHTLGLREKVEKRRDVEGTGGERLRHRSQKRKAYPKQSSEPEPEGSRIKGKKRGITPMSPCGKKTAEKKKL